MPDAPLSPLLTRLSDCMIRHGWDGRMFGVSHWLRGGTFADDRAATISVVVIRRHSRPDVPYAGFARLRKEDIPFRGILTDIPSDLPAQNQGETDTSCADVHLILDPGTPWYTAFNTAAACAVGDILIFLDGEATPQADLLAAYRQTFEAHPETVAARGMVQIPGLEDCACQATGSFSLDEETVYWPVDLDENMAVRAEEFFALGGFDESLIGGYGALDLSIRLFGRTPDCHCQRYVPRARLMMTDPGDSGLPLEQYLLERQRSWLQLNDTLITHLKLYAEFWQKQCGGSCRG